MMRLVTNQRRRGSRNSHSPGSAPTRDEATVAFPSQVEAQPQKSGLHLSSLFTVTIHLHFETLEFIYLCTSLFCVSCINKHLEEFLESSLVKSFKGLQLEATKYAKEITFCAILQVVLCTAFLKS